MTKRNHSRKCTTSDTQTTRASRGYSTHGSYSSGPYPDQNPGGGGGHYFFINIFVTIFCPTSFVPPPPRRIRPCPCLYRKNVRFFQYCCNQLDAALHADRADSKQVKNRTRRVASCLYAKEGRSVLFNDALNTFYLRLYGVGHMVKDHSDSERGNPLPPHGLLFPINSKGSFICTIPQTGLQIPRPLLHQLWSTGWNEKIAQCVHPTKDRSDDPSHHERTLLPRSYISLPVRKNATAYTSFGKKRKENSLKME